MDLKHGQSSHNPAHHTHTNLGKPEKERRNDQIPLLTISQRNAPRKTKETTVGVDKVAQTFLRAVVKTILELWLLSSWFAKSPKPGLLHGDFGSMSWFFARTKGPSITQNSQFCAWTSNSPIRKLGMAAALSGILSGVPEQNSG